MHQSRLSALVLALCVQCLVWAPDTAAADCGYFKPLGALTAYMHDIAAGQAGPLDVAAQHAGQIERQIDLPEIRKRLRSVHLSAYITEIQQLLALADQFSRTELRPDSTALQGTLLKVDVLLDVLCDLPKHLTAVGQVGAGGGRKTLLEVLETQSGMVKIGLLGAVLFGLIFTLYGVKICVGYAIGLLMHKKTCRVPAVICGDGQEIPGIVTRAGLNGVRLEFDSDATAGRLTDLMASPTFVNFDLRIGEDTWPVFVDGFHTFFAPLYFLERLTQQELRDILVRSTRKPQVAPSIGHRSTRLKWRAQIKKRKKDIQDTARKRTAVR